MNNSINNLFIAALNNNKKIKTILIKFYGRHDLVEYPVTIIDILKNDKHVQDIIDGSTGEVLFTHDNL